MDHLSNKLTFSPDIDFYPGDGGEQGVKQGDGGEQGLTCDGSFEQYACHFHRV